MWLLAATQSFYCFTMGSLTSLLTLYLVYRLQLSPATAFGIFAAMNSLLYTLPLAGGYIGEKLGYTLTITFGLVIVCIGFTALGIPEKHFMYLGIAFFVTGNSFIAPNISALVGLYYPKKSTLRDSGYTLYFLIYNGGFFLSPLIFGFISLDNYNLAFLTSIFAVLIALSIFVVYLKSKKFRSTSLLSFKNKYPFHKRIILLTISLSVLIAVALFLLERVTLNDRLLCLLTAFSMIGMIIWATKQNQSGRLKMLAFLFLCVLSVGFWSLYMLLPSLLTIFISQNVNRDIFGLILPPSAYYSLDALFVILLGFFFSCLWYYCATKKKDVSLIKKFALSLLSIGIAYLIFALGVAFANHITHLVNSFWIVMGYLLLAAGELMISPIALSMVGVLMPKGQEGLGMGIWRIFIGFSAIISGFLANLVNAPRRGDPLVTNPHYLDAFLKMGVSTLIIGAVILLFTNKIKRSLQI